MRKLNKKLIKQLANDDIAVKNTGTVEDLTEILKAAFPEGPVPTGNTMFYKKHTDFYWMGYDKPPQFPIHPTEPHSGVISSPQRYTPIPNNSCGIVSI